MSNLIDLVLDKVDISKPYWTMYEEFLIKWDEDDELETILKDVSVEEIETTFKEIYKIYYAPDSSIVCKETTCKESKGLTKHKLVNALNSKGEILLFNMTIGIMMSNTSYQKMLKKYSLDDIDRQRLYCLFHKHVRPDDTFVKDLEDAGVKWKPIQIKNPRRIMARFPEISA